MRKSDGTPSLKNGFCVRCGLTSDHVTKEDAETEMEFFECNLPTTKLPVGEGRATKIAGTSPALKPAALAVLGRVLGYSHGGLVFDIAEVDFSEVGVEYSPQKLLVFESVAHELKSHIGTRRAATSKKCVVRVGQYDQFRFFHPCQLPIGEPPKPASEVQRGGWRKYQSKFDVGCLPEGIQGDSRI
jgi:hypothetical protein